MAGSIKKLECLIVSDRYMTEDARFADVVFPASTMFETWSLTTGADGRQMTAARSRTIEEVGTMC